MKPIILALACLSVFTLDAQEQSVSEEEISLNILKWHYTTYPMSVASSWKVINAEGKYYRARFEFEGKQYLVEYDPQGRVTHEVIDLQEEVPVSIAHGLEKYEKYKINSFLKINDKENDKTMYKLDLKIKSEGQKVIWYDENFIQMPKSDFSRSVTDLY